MWMLVLGLAMGAGGAAVWQPPAKPDPQSILQEAESDARAGRHELALAKHEWFHREALKHDPGFYGVHLSFALSSWKELGRSYPPAFASLKRFRDEALAQVMGGRGGHAEFHDFESINAVLGETARTREAFLRLDKERPDLAKQVYNVAEPALVEAADYAICGRYVEAEARWAGIAYRHATDKGLVGQFGPEFKAFMEQSLTHETALLIALLVLNERTGEAEGVASKARLEWDDASFHQAIDAALKGEVPKPFP